jgi:hypothetical protein
VNDTYVIPVSANTPGAFNTRWMTQFSVFNPQSYPLKVSVTFLPTLGGQGIEAFITVPANATRYSDNVLNDVFGVAGSGALLVATFPEDNPTVPNDAFSRAFLVTTNTYNNAKSGTYGQTIPGIWTGLQDFDSDGISALAHGIRNLDAIGWRTNVGATNLGNHSVTMYVDVFDENGQRVLKNAPFTIPPYAHLQDRLPVQVDRATIEFWVDDPANTAVVFPYVSIVDQFSGDSTYQTPMLYATAKELYGKGAPSAQMQSFGTKVTLERARSIRATASHLGEIRLERSESTLQRTH